MKMKNAMIRVPASATIFVLEDSATRLDWFQERFGRVNVQYSSTVEDALEKLIDLDRDAYLFLDHDLNWHDAAGRKPGSGVRVAHYVSKMQFTGKIVIHSVNEAGAAEMKKWLPQAELHPFGSFEISYDGADEVSSRKSAIGCVNLAHPFGAAAEQPIKVTNVS